MPLFPCLLLHPRVSSSSPGHPVLKPRACVVLPPRDVVSSWVGDAMWIRVHSGSCPVSLGSPSEKPGLWFPFQEFLSPTPPPACVPCSQLLAALTSLVSRGLFLLFLPAGLSPLFLYGHCCGEFGQDLRKQQCLAGPRLIRRPWWCLLCGASLLKAAGRLQLHTWDFCDSSITLAWLHHGMGFMVKLNTPFLAESLDGLTLRTKVEQRSWACLLRIQ